MQVELIYDASCPNAGRARSVLIQAFARTGISARWKEWDRAAPESPSHTRALGSPTILVDGKDVAGDAAGQAGDSCRLYRDAQGALSGTPTVEAIVAALLQAAGTEHETSLSEANVPTTRKFFFKSWLPVGAAAWSALACPVCLAPVYAALLSTVGLAVPDPAPYLFLPTIAILGIAIASLWLRAKRTGWFVSPALGVLAAGLVVVGTFVSRSDLLTLGGAALLIVATLLGRRIARVDNSASCPACAVEPSDRDAKASL